MTAASPNLWDAGKARSMSEPERLLYRSQPPRLRLRITNFGGGNTSAKVMQRDPLSGLDVRVLWVKARAATWGA